MARVLLIDDDQSSLDYMEQVLRLDGHEFAWAADGTQDLALVQQFRPELIICDVVMPRLGGLRCWRQSAQARKRPTFRRCCSPRS